MSGTRYAQILQDQITQAARDGHSPQIEGAPAATTKHDGKLDAPEHRREHSEGGQTERKVSMGEKISGALHNMLRKGHKKTERSSEDESSVPTAAPAPQAEHFPASDPAPIPIPPSSEGNTNAFPSSSASPSRKYLPGAEPSSNTPQGHTLPRILPASVASALHPTIAPEHILVNPLRGSPAGAVASPERAAGSGAGAGESMKDSIKRGSVGSAGSVSSGGDKPKPGPHGPLPASEAPKDTSLHGLTPISPSLPTPTSPTRPTHPHTQTRPAHFSPPTPTYAHYRPHGSIASTDEYGSTVSETGSVPPSAPPSVAGSVPAGSAAAFEAWRNAGVLDPFPTPPASGTPHVAGGSEKRSTSAERGKSAYDALNGFPTGAHVAHVAHVEHAGGESEGEGEEGLRVRELRGYGHGRGAHVNDEGKKAAGAGEAAEGVGRLGLA
ncbi:hypothetical protein IAT38_007114 [Cryptococcus sp. DSM 104549]